MRILSAVTKRDDIGLVDFIAMMAKSSVARVSGMAVFLTGHPDATTHGFAAQHQAQQSFARNGILNVVTQDMPRVPKLDRIVLKRLSDDFTSVTIRFGYMERPNVPKALVACRTQGLKFDVMSTSFFLSRRALRLARQSKIPRWQDRLFIALARSSDNASKYFHIPSGRAVEIGTQVTV